jgi:hypothetical protein
MSCGLLDTGLPVAVIAEQRELPFSKAGRELPLEEPSGKRGGRGHFRTIIFSPPMATSTSKLLLLFYLFAMPLIVIQCRAKENNVWKGSIEEDNGVTIVIIPTTPQLNRDVVEFQEDFIIKGSDGKANYLFVKPESLLVDEKNNIYVLDSREANIKVFDERGQFLRIIGRQGPGPGDLDGAVFMDISRNEIAVYCAGNRRLVYFDLQGTHRRSLYAGVGLLMMKVDSRGNIFAVCAAYRDGQTRYEVQKFDPNLKYLRTFASHNWTKPSYFASQATFTITKADLVVYGNPETYELKIFNNDGKLLRRILKEKKLVRIPREEIEIVARLPKVDDKLPEYYMPFYFFYVDEEGRIIVYAHGKLGGNRERTFDIFSPEGKFLATISLGYHTACLWANRRLYAIEEDKDGLPIVKAYRVMWKIR